MNLTVLIRFILNLDGFLKKTQMVHVKHLPSLELKRIITQFGLGGGLIQGLPVSQQPTKDNALDCYTAQPKVQVQV